MIAAAARAGGALALTLVWAAASAQTDAQEAVAPAAGPDWGASAAEVLFADAERTAVRDAAAIREDWPTLPQATREAIERDCAAIAIDARAVEGAASGGVLDADGMLTPGAEGADRAEPEASATAEACAIVRDL